MIDAEDFALQWILATPKAYSDVPLEAIAKISFDGGSAMRKSAF